jgi:hypothetical protein
MGSVAVYPVRCLYLYLYLYLYLAVPPLAT